MPTATDTAHVRRLLAAFAAVAVAFIGTTIFAEARALRIDQEAEALATNALPSIDELSAANAAIRNLETLSDDYPDAPAVQQPEMRRRIQQLRAETDARLRAYRALPVYEGEEALYAELAPELTSVDAGLGRLFGAVDAGDQAQARILADHEVRRAVNRVAHVMRQLIALNVAGGQANTARIVSLRGESMRIAFVFDTLSFVLAIVATWLAVQAVRRYTSVLREHGELIERRADELERFGERVAHDLLSPLSALSFSLDAIARAAGSDPKVAEAAARGKRSLLRARDMTRSLFDFARSGAVPERSARADVEAVIAEVIEEVTGSEEEPPEILVEPSAGHVAACTKGVLQSIVTNLVRNAAKYTRDSALRRITVRVTDSGPRVRVEVEDTGPGLPPGLESRLFEPYVRAEGLTQPGLGLGLATVKRLCEGHGGSVGVRPAADHGCVFWFELPRVRAPAQAEQAPVQAAS